jgi:hypothetical protein
MQIQKAVDYIQSNGDYIQKAIDMQNAVWRGEKIDMPPLALSCWLTEEQASWLPYYNTKETHFDSEKMFINGLRDALNTVNGSYGAVPSMRANMGCGIIASLFGNQQRLFDDKMPWLVDYAKKEDIQNMDEKHNFRLEDSAEFAAAMEHIQYMSGVLRDNGLTGKVFVFTLDLQGPIDTAHLIYGDTILYDFYDDPEFVHHLLDKSCESIYFAMSESFKRIELSGELIAHYNHLIIPAELGGIKTSEDTTTLMSPAHIDEFARPHLRKMLEHFNGGYVHYCGKNDYLLDVILEEPLVRGINLGNTDMHDMTNVLARCRDARKIYTGGIHRNGGENLFDYFTRILEPSYDKNTGCFYIIPQYGCNLSERGQVIGEFERAVEKIKN